MATHADSPWPHRLSVLTAATTLLLIFVGGLVTNTGSALAVPDWPTTFGYNMFLYPWSKMVGGIFYEHSHRLIGSTVGLLTVLLAVSLWLTEPRRWVRGLGLVAVVAVIIQGVLGGLRVVLLQHPLAIFHACLAQAFFALLVSLAVLTSRFWQDATAAPHLFDGARLRAAALATAFLIYAQTVFGALLTHTGTRLDAHLLVAALVTASVLRLAVRIFGGHAERRELRRPLLLLSTLLIIQLSLGLSVYLWRYTAVSAALTPALGVMFQALHRIVGTAILGAAVLLAVRIIRLSGVAGPAAAPADQGEGHFVGQHEVLA